MVTERAVCPSCGGLCWTDRATAVCRDRGGTGVVVDPQPVPERRRHVARKGRHRPDDRSQR